MLENTAMTHLFVALLTKTKKIKGTDYYIISGFMSSDILWSTLALKI